MSDVRESFFPENNREPTAVERRVAGRRISYADVNAEYYPGNGHVLAIDSAAVKQKILNLLGTLVGEEHFEPLWGSDLPKRLFEPIVTGDNWGQQPMHQLQFRIRSDTITAIDTFMRGEISLILPACRVAPLPEEDGFLVVVAFTEDKTGRDSSFSFTFLRPNK